MLLDLTDLPNQDRSNVLVPFKEGTVAFSPEDHICVLRKKHIYYEGASRMFPKDIGDGMEVVVGKHTAPLQFPLDITAFLRGLCIWQEFNEERNGRETYLYKFPKNDERIALLNNFLQACGCEQRVVRHQRFVSIEPCPKFQIPSVEDMTLEELLSFFFGLVLGYGQIDLADSEIMIHRIFVSFPLVGVTAIYQEFLEKMKARFFVSLLLMQTDTIPGKTGFTRQVSCKDRELLSLYATRLVPVFPKFADMPAYQTISERYLGVSVTDLPDHIRGYSVLKKLTK